MAKPNPMMVPGIVSGQNFHYRNLFRGGDKTELPGGIIIDGSKSRDPANSAHRVDVLLAGNAMGRITASKKYAPSILGVLTVAYDASATPGQMTVGTAVATELNRRIGSSGTFKLTGPPSAAGTVRTITITYSAVNTSTGVITVTDISEDTTPGASIAETTKGVTAVSGVSEVEEIQTITISGTPTGGTFQVGYNGEWTTELAYDISAANMQTALRLLTGLGTVTCAGGALPGTAIAVTMVDLDSPELLELDLSNLTGGTPAGTVVATTPYVAEVSAVSAVTEIQTITMSANDGTFRVGYNGEWTGELDHDVSTANLQTALQALTGLGSVTVAGTAGSSYVITLTGLTGDVALLELQTGNLVSYYGDFIAGSFVQPTDGSEAPVGLLFRPDGTRVTDDDLDSIDVGASLAIAGTVDSSQIVWWPTDTSLIAWLKAQLNAAGNFIFDDVF